MASLLFHFAVVVSLSFKRRPTPPQQERVEVDFLAEPELKPPVDDSLKGAKPKEKTRDQIVEQEKQINKELDKDSRFLSAFNQKVIRQTRADRSGKFSNQAKGSKKAPGQVTGDKKLKLAETDRKLERGEMPQLKDLTPKYSMDPGQLGPQADDDGNPSQSDDYIKDVKTGMQTLLSTREFVYYAYYNRIKLALRQHWEPEVREKVKIIYRQGRSIASAKDRVTQVMVTLDSRGELVGVEVITASGVVDLDAAAVQAFKEAAPFPNPPKGMIEADGKVKIRWDFVLEV